MITNTIIIIIIVVIIVIIITRNSITRIIITRIIILHLIYGNTDSNTVGAPASARQWRSSSAIMEPTAGTMYGCQSISIYLYICLDMSV